MKKTQIERMQERYPGLLDIPWVNYVEKGQTCDGYRWSAMPMKAVHARPGTELREKYRCKVSAHWKYRAAKGSRWSESGTYCIHHLFSSCLLSMEEDARYDRWLKRYGKKVES